MANSMIINSLSGSSQLAAPLTTVSASINGDGTSVDATTSTTTGSKADNLITTKANTQMDKQDFLMLFVKQLQNQDPTSPMDNSQMMSQMSQLQSLESSTNMEKAITDLSASYKTSLSAQQNSVQAMTNATSVSLIGKTVRVKQDELTYSGHSGESDPIKVNLGSNASADVQILDNTGTVVKTLNASGKDSQNAATVTWDGSSDKGALVPEGTYKINVVGSDADPSLYAFVENTVQGVGFSSSGATLQVGGQEMPVANVMNVSTDNAATSLSQVSPSTAIGLLGKTIRVMDNTVNFTAQDNESHQIKVNANKQAPVNISIVDSQGTVVDRMSATASDAGVANFSWNGLTTNGSYAAAGTYSVKIDGQENNPSLYAFDDGTVDGVNTLGGVTQLRMNGQIVSLSSIIDIATKTAS